MKNNRPGVAAVTHYICEKCRTAYADREAAEQCAALHKAVTSAIPRRYLPKGVFAKPFPYELLVRVEGQKKAVYEFKREVTS